MIRDLAKIYMSIIAELPFAEKVGGLVELTSDDSRKMLVSCDYIYPKCEPNKDYLEFVPSVDLKSMFFFENDNGARLKDQKAGNIMVFETELRLVGWINKKKLGYDDCNLTTLIQNSILKALTTTDKINQFKTSPFLAIKTKSVKEDAKKPSIFTKNQYKDNFRFNPYDYFSLTIGVDYYIDYSCLEDFVTKTPLEC
jgi:hypothetical protein